MWRDCFSLSDTGRQQATRPWVVCRRFFYVLESSRRSGNTVCNHLHSTPFIDVFSVNTLLWLGQFGKGSRMGHFGIGPRCARRCCFLTLAERLARCTNCWDIDTRGISVSLVRKHYHKLLYRFRIEHRAQDHTTRYRQTRSRLFFGYDQLRRYDMAGTGLPLWVSQPAKL